MKGVQPPESGRPVKKPLGFTLGGFFIGAEWGQDGRQGSSQVKKAACLDSRNPLVSVVPEVGIEPT